MKQATASYASYSTFQPRAVWFNCVVRPESNFLLDLIACDSVIRVLLINIYINIRLAGCAGTTGMLGQPEMYTNKFLPRILIFQYWREIRNSTCLYNGSFPIYQAIFCLGNICLTVSIYLFLTGDSQIEPLLQSGTSATSIRFL